METCSSYFCETRKPWRDMVYVYGQYWCCISCMREHYDYVKAVKGGENISLAQKL